LPGWRNGKRRKGADFQVWCLLVGVWLALLGLFTYARVASGPHGPVMLTATPCVADTTDPSSSGIAFRLDMGGSAVKYLRKEDIERSTLKVSKSVSDLQSA
jgi:hypothetical protein